MTYKRDTSQALLQERSGRRIWVRYHDLLLEAGFQWDGMDGYTAPEGWTPEQSKDLWEQACCEVKK